MSTLKPVRQKLNRPVKHAFLRSDNWLELFPEVDPKKTLQSGRVMAKAWSKTLEQSEHLGLVQVFLNEIISSYWQVIHNRPLRQWPLPTIQTDEPSGKIDSGAIAVANAIGKAAAQMDVVTAAYHLGNLYTALLPEGMRSANGVFYTPPALTRRLLEMSVNAGVDWEKASVADPACGGGAFLAPVALEIAKVIRKKNILFQLEHIETHLKGFEIDPFAAWMTQVFVEVAVKDIIAISGRRMKNLVRVCNTLEQPFDANEKFDLIIGNPPYGKIKLNDIIKERYKDGLYGHPNLYGLFTQVALKMVKPDGVIGYLTPTSFLSGEYFKNLRALLRKEVTPSEIDFVSVRKGVFDDVLQETMLASYRKKKNKSKKSFVQINEMTTLQGEEVKLKQIARYTLPEDKFAPWILPRKPEQADNVIAMSRMSSRLKDWGYRISTGQLVWNRHKNQLTDDYSKGCFPIIWSEAVTPNGDFVLKAEKKNHAVWFNLLPKDSYLLTTSSCLLLQRTTAKEQEKRLIAAVLPQSVLNKAKAVVVENHLNMIIPIKAKPSVNLKVLSVFLNSKATNDAFRAISGSVAVSAYELESLPLPDVSLLRRLKNLIEKGANQELIEQECLNLYTV